MTPLSLNRRKDNETKNPEKARYQSGESVILTAVAAGDYYFKDWSGDITETENPTTIVMDSDKSITATFEAYQTQNIPLDRGWNFVSIHVDPTEPRIDRVFSSISDKVEYVRHHMHWWMRGIGGSLTEVSYRHSYYIKTNAECVLTITGRPMQLPYELTLEKGWNSILYPYDEDSAAIGRTQQPSVYTGFFKDIMADIAWIKGGAKGASNWCTPEVGDITLTKGKGIFIKLKNPCTLRFPLK